jgi:hypothetical protein
MSECQSTGGEWGKPCPDCGQVLPTALPWEYGRPCAKTALDRGHGWDGREMPQHTARERARWAQPGVIPRTPVGGRETQL